jgi:hypothetical protein
MDTKEFTIVAGETLDSIELRLTALAVNEVDVLAEDDSTLLIVNGTSEIRLTPDRTQSRLLADAGGAVARFSYHDIEELWFSDETQTELFAWLGVRISSLLGHTVDLRGD